MPKKIIYFVQRYRPSYEAISKEVKILTDFFRRKNKVKLYDLHLDGLFRFKFSKKVNSYHFAFYPLMALFANLLSRRSGLNHIYTSLGDLPYLNVLNLKKTILTGAASCNFEKIRKRIRKLRKLKNIIVESEKQKQELISLGIKEEKVEIIYPPVDLDDFSYEKAKGEFKILYASCPTRKEDFRKRGMILIRDAAEKVNVDFDLAWRGGAYKDVKKLIRGLKNIKIKNEVVEDMNKEYGKVHCIIIPYTKFDDFLKLMPNSGIESLAAGKPLLVSSKTELAKFVEKEKCGIVFEPNAAELVEAIKELKKNYARYQKNCRKTAGKYFSKELFIEKYQKVYNEI